MHLYIYIYKVTFSTLFLTTRRVWHVIHKTSVETILMWKRNDKMMVSTQAYAFLSVLFISNWVKCVYFSDRKDMSR